MITAATTVTRAPGVLGEEVLGETVVLDPEADRYARLNRSGGVLWTRLAHPATVAELAEELGTTFDIERDRALADATSLVEQLAERGLVTLS